MTAEAQAEEHCSGDEQEDPVELRLIEVDPAGTPEQAGKDRRVIGP